MIPLINHDSSEGEQWGRYNLPRYMYIYSISKLIKIHNVNPQFMIFPTGDMMIQLQSTSNLYGFFCGVMSTPD